MGRGVRAFFRGLEIGAFDMGAEEGGGGGKGARGQVREYLGGWVSWDVLNCVAVEAWSGRRCDSGKPGHGTAA